MEILSLILAHSPLVILCDARPGVFTRWKLNFALWRVLLPSIRKHITHTERDVCVCAPPVEHSILIWLHIGACRTQRSHTVHSARVQNRHDTEHALTCPSPYRTMLCYALCHIAYTKCNVRTSGGGVRDSNQIRCRNTQAAFRFGIYNTATITYVHRTYNRRSEQNLFCNSIEIEMSSHAIITFYLQMFMYAYMFVPSNILQTLSWWKCHLVFCASSTMHIITVPWWIAI